MKRIFFLFLFSITSFLLFAQLQSPEQFLGYKIGSRYTPHWRIVEYYRHVAAAMPSVMKLQSYGQTNEGRPLMVAYLSTTGNISNLENIRTNNLALAQMGEGKTGTVANAPVIVWLSYNVHGNETSSSEASMMTLYSLVDPANTRTKAWLQNTVVIIDPCLNPDGRDRYVNWFNSVTGKQYNPVVDAREHREPWPGGRTNHYNFDLNRDWAWQTQVETQQRLKVYNEWLPQIHVDFHEQGINNPYYFAPAAEPFHEVITPWQRSFQNTIGRNHAKYFDEKGWLYFTRERFDLLYPSYGDTYPIYSGSIGMTYEQGGGPSGGAAVLTADGDTLTLFDRATHHYTTSLSTLEVASQNAAKLLTEFQTFYRSAVTGGSGEYKAYVIKYTPQDRERIAALLDLLQKNKIEYGAAKAASLRGFNYDSGKEEAFSLTASDIVISAVQPKATLINVLFEANTKVSDSVTYDITAWSMPYAYGLKVFATKSPVAVSGGSIAAEKVANPAADPYGYVIRWNGVQSVKLAMQLAQKGIRLRFTEQPFETGSQQFERGAVIVLRTSNQYYSNLWETVRSLATANNVQLAALTTGMVEKGADFGSSRIHSIKNRKIALVTGEGVGSNAAGEIWHFFDQVLGYPITLINAADLGRIDWKDIDVLIMPDGNYRYLSDKTSSDAFRTWITGGGNVVALEGAVAQLARLDWAIKAKKTDDSGDTKSSSYETIRQFENRERDFIPGTTPGSIYRVELDNTHPLAFGYPKYYYTLKQDNALYDFIKEGGWNVGVLKKGKQVAGFVGSKLVNRLQDGLLFGVQDIGRGSITYLADDVLFRSFWENGKLMFCNAVFLVGQ
ncbi:MAG TPA: M14 metallopeptidase family protein [Flavisolibacter sp.]|nr:M14 metallopeptidase family protein [Flavisolibacter sp.]